jgi:hypothetical protein
MITHESPMSDVLASMAAGQDAGCSEFVRRQGRDNFAGLDAMLSNLHRGVWNV